MMEYFYDGTYYRWNIFMMKHIHDGIFLCWNISMMEHIHDGTNTMMELIHTNPTIKF